MPKKKDSGIVWGAACEGCVYSVELSVLGMKNLCCDYYGRTGRLRSQICQAREKCTVRRTTLPAAGAPKGPKPRKRLDREQALALYQEGKSDVAIARTLGVPTSTVWRWRTKERLPVSGTAGQPEKRRS